MQQQSAATCSISPRCQRAGKRVSRSASKNDVLALFASDLEVWWRAYFSVGILVGLRPGERLGLRWEDVDFEAGIIRVRVMLRRVERDGRKVFELGDLKTDRSARAETMPADVAAALTALKRAQASDRLRYGKDYGSGLDNCAKGLVFCGKHSEPRHGQAILKKMKDLFEAAGLGKDWVPRDQRKTFGTVIRKLGKGPMADVSAAMGHSAIGGHGPRLRRRLPSGRSRHRRSHRQGISSWLRSRPGPLTSPAVIGSRAGTGYRLRLRIA